ncbi:hypothetical protein [uncultured Draconibacterium sp.]|uniref:mannitol dehydrogenase family protein n=1 Tax=uncultured Draconibacterium sp. TaxID=1573823 RepID=UPI0029C7002B|nr:hypothetical protein [uncultured Draconibacterium sp.]
MKKLVLFGAGKIGRSFVGQLFAQSGYEVVFIDIDEMVITELNAKRQYKVVIKSNSPDQVLLVKNVRGVLGTQKDKVVSELVSCDLAAVSVGQRGLMAINPILARAITERKRIAGNPLDIIIAENMRNADEFIFNELSQNVENDFPLKDWVGLVETSIGKMVPIMPDEEVQRDPLLVYAEPYNTLILDKKAFKNPIPEVEGVAPKDNIKAWVDRKSYIHNFGHAATAYAGHLASTDAVYLSEVLESKAVKKFVRSAMLQSANILVQKYRGEFTIEDLTLHIDDLLHRFSNRALRDTVFRVGCDLQRKLHRNDRVLSPLLDGIRMNLPENKIMQVFAYGLCFGQKDENGNRIAGDKHFSKMLYTKGLPWVLTNICGLKRDEDTQYIQRILAAQWSLSPLKLTLGNRFAKNNRFQHA